MEEKSFIEKQLEKPNFTDIERAIEKIRNKLMLLSFFAIFISKYEIDLENGLKFLGIYIKDITLFDISIVITILIIYLSINLIWASSNRWLEWNIRRTGMNKYATVVKSFTSSGIDYPNDYKQSTLYTYWIAKKSSIPDFEKAFNNIDVKGLDAKKVDEINKLLKQLKDILYDERIELSLKRFDESFFRKISFEYYRSILFDIIIPILFAIGSLYYLCSKNIFV